MDSSVQWLDCAVALDNYRAQPYHSSSIQAIMLISKDHRRQIHEALFKEGVLVAKKDHNAPTHMEIEGIPNLEVIKACQSLTSRGYVKTQFSWQYYYYVLTSEGIEYLREW